MSIVYPGGLDSLTNPTSANTLDSPDHAQQHSDANDAIEAIEAKVGKDGSAVTSSHDYKLSGVTGTDKAVSKTGTETLTNKTLTAPTVTSPSISGTVGGSATYTTPTLTDPAIQGLFDGWVAANETWTYASATTFTITGDRTDRLAVGTKIKLSQSGIKYFYVTASSFAAGTTTVTVNGGSDYSLANAAITSPSYSQSSTPVAFPQSFNYTPTYANLTAGNGTHATAFSMSGKTVTMRLGFTLGSTSSVGTNPTFTLPVTSTNSYLASHGIGAATYVDTGVQAFSGPIWWTTTTTASLIYPRMDTFAGDVPVKFANIIATKPFAWGTADYIAGALVYEAA